MGQGGGIGKLSEDIILTGTGDPAGHPQFDLECGCHTTVWVPNPNTNVGGYVRSWNMCPVHDRARRDRYVALHGHLFGAPPSCICGVAA